MKINFIYDSNVSREQMIGYEIAALVWGQLVTDEIKVNIFAKSTDSLESNVIGGAIPEFHEQHYALFQQYYEADITSEEDQLAYDALQQGNTIDFLLNGELISGNTKLKLTTALAKALGMTEAISLERYVLDESEDLLDGTIAMNQDFTWDFNYLRDSEAPENTLDFLSVALHETGHILGFTSSLDFSLQQETLYSGRTELSNFSPLDLFRFSAESLAQNNADGVVNDLSIGGVALFSTDGGETVSAKMSTGKEGDGFQASHWERRDDPLGIMDPTLWYQERAVITDLDVLAFDIMGYNLSSEAEEVENLFSQEGLEGLLAQAKVQLAHKLEMTVQELEDQANVPLSSLELIQEMETAYLEAAAAEGSTTETTSTVARTTSTVNSSSNSELDSLSDNELNDFSKDLNKTMRGVYRWWAAHNNSSNFAWQKLYQWWIAHNNSSNFTWQELSEEELAEFHQEVTSNQSSSSPEVFFASQDGGNLENLQLPGRRINSGTDNRQFGRRINSGTDNRQLSGWWINSGTDNGQLSGWRINSGTNGVYQEVNDDHDDDIIGGDISNDNIVGGKGDDLIDGAAGDDTIFGAEGYDTIFGFDGNDSIMGGMGDDLIWGESDADALFGEAGADVLMGGEHDDYLDGGAGNDAINGTDDIVAGYLELDVLVGAAGSDIFILGDDTQVYYATGGEQDYALIKDFDSSLDFIQLHGVAGDYQQQQQGNDIHLSRNGDLLAILENNSTLNLNGSAILLV